ncbi:serine hydrolase domain-containing protein [Streptomyces sp. NPDC000351]|uniref:serine hydrolase domain-containing protein n=1 Tax=Streptomyces sp. NPDC000351 TaxID=3154250 RepID=UPI00331C9AB5
MAVKRGRITLSGVIGLVCATLLTSPGTAYAQTTDDHPATLAALRTFQAAAGPGAAVHAGAAGDTWTLSAGTGTLGSNRPIQQDEHFLIGSQTKSFTAAVVLQLVDEGEVSLDAPVEQYLPGVVTGNGYDGTRITVRHLLQHTSGIAAYNPRPNLSAPPVNADGSYDLREVVRKGLSFAAVSAPGASSTYSNTNYLILGMLIEAVTRTPVREAVTARIIEPLGLSSTSFPAAGDDTVPEPSVIGYTGVRFNGLFVGTKADIWDPSLYSSAAAMISTLEDVTTFYQALLAGEIVSSASLSDMLDDGGFGYGLGLAPKQLTCGGTAWGHDGALPGYSTATAVTTDGRHASLVTNAHFAVNTPTEQMKTLLDTALCESRP